MTRIKKQILTLITSSALGVPLMMGGEAQARSQAAILGHELLGSQAACFNESAGGVIQTGAAGCQSPSPASNWDLPIVYDSAGTANITVNAAGTGMGTHNVVCRAFSATWSGTVSAGSQMGTTRNTGETEPLLTSVYANGFGGTWVSCRMDPQTRIFNVSY